VQEVRAHPRGVGGLVSRLLVIGALDWSGGSHALAPSLTSSLGERGLRSIVLTPCGRCARSRMAGAGIGDRWVERVGLGGGETAVVSGRGRAPDSVCGETVFSEGGQVGTRFQHRQAGCPLHISACSSGVIWKQCVRGRVRWTCASAEDSVGDLAMLGGDSIGW